MTNERGLIPGAVLPKVSESGNHIITSCCWRDSFEELFPGGVEKISIVPAKPSSLSLILAM